MMTSGSHHHHHHLLLYGHSQRCVSDMEANIGQHQVADNNNNNHTSTMTLRAQIHGTFWSGCRLLPTTKSTIQSATLWTWLILPLLLIFLLPSLKLEHHQIRALRTTTQSSATDFMLALIRLPLDRVRLTSGLSGAAAASSGMALAPQRGSSSSSSSDLQEEETHMMVLTPAEHRGGHGGPPHLYEGEAAGAHSQAQPLDYVAAENQGGPDQMGVAPGQGEPVGVAEAPMAGGSQSAIQVRNDLPAVRALNVKCEKNHMTVNIVFDRPFYGMVFSKGHYNDQKCVHLPPNSGQTSVNFDIHLGKCGMSSSDAMGASGGHQQQQQQQLASAQQQQPNGLFIENTIIIQYDPLVQEIYDQARKLRCTWYDYYEKSVTFRPYNVDMLDAVTANFLGDNIQCWMQIQVGKGPWSSEVAGIVKIGQTMTMVLAIKDDENRFDMLVRNCVAHDGKHQPIQLVDEYGCVARPKIMGKFQKVRNFGPAATVVSYAHFQAFKFPDSMSVHFQCVIQVCRYECPVPDCPGGGGPAGELGGGGSGGGGSGPSGDYAASGTEMVAAKEPMPSSSIAYMSANHSLPGHSNLHLKLDESQGRVQVKLDTSMMAAMGAAASSRPPISAQSGPLPPHLLHSVSSSPMAPSGDQSRAYMSSSYYRPSASVATTSTNGLGGGPNLLSIGTAGRPATIITGNRIAPTTSSSTTTTSSTTQPGSYGPPPHAQQVHYSPQYPHPLRRAAYATNRIGELALDTDPSGLINHYDDDEGRLLSLIAAPRGLRSGAQILAANHRLKRSINSANETLQRHGRHLGAKDSTNIQTQKTIQVVSPDDVAFSLLSDSMEDSIVTNEFPTTRRKLNVPMHMSPNSTVCFSAVRLMLGILVTLAALVCGIVAVTYVILRQRSQLEQKISTVYEDRDKDNHLLESRQRREIEQRSNRLARICSQFTPANHWR